MLFPTSYGSRDSRAQLRVLRALATLEWARAALVLVGACGVVLLIKHDPWDVANNLLDFLHISPDSHFAQMFLDWADTLTTSKLRAVVAVAFVYVILRSAEGYGLWHARPWGEWIALVSGAIYFPFELLAIVHRPDLFHFGVFLVNLAIVLYIAWRRWGALRHPVRDGHLASTNIRH